MSPNFSLGKASKNPGALLFFVRGWAELLGGPEWGIVLHKKVCSQGISPTLKNRGRFSLGERAGTDWLAQKRPQPYHQLGRPQTPHEKLCSCKGYKILTRHVKLVGCFYLTTGLLLINVSYPVKQAMKQPGTSYPLLDRCKKLRSRKANNWLQSLARGWNGGVLYCGPQPCHFSTPENGQFK